MFSRNVIALGLAAFSAVLLPNLALAAGPHTCEINEVTEKASIIHVRCANAMPAGSDSVTYFALPKSHAGASRFFSLATATLLAGRDIRVEYDSDRTKASPLCDPTNCRLVIGFGAR